MSVDGQKILEDSLRRTEERLAGPLVLERCTNCDGGWMMMGTFRSRCGMCRGTGISPLTLALVRRDIGLPLFFDE